MAIREGAEFGYSLKVDDQGSAPVKEIAKEAETATEKLDVLAHAVLAANQALELLGKAWEFAKTTIKDSVGIVIEMEHAQHDLAIAMKLTGQYSKANVEDFTSFTKSLKSTTLASTGQVVSMLRQAQALGKSHEMTKLLAKTSVDLAEVLHTDVDSAFNQLLLTTNGVTRGLGRYFPALKSLTEEQLKAGEGVKMLSERLAGFGAEAARARPFEMLEKSLKGLKVAFGELALALVRGDVHEGEGFIGQFIPMVDAATKAVKSLKEPLIEIHDAIMDVAKAFAAMARAIDWGAVARGAAVITATAAGLAALSGAISALNMPLILLVSNWAIFKAGVVSALGPMAQMAKLIALQAARFAIMAAQIALVTAGLVTTAFTIELVIRNFQHLDDVWTVVWTHVIGGIKSISLELNKLAVSKFPGLKNFSLFGKERGLGKEIAQQEKDLEELAQRAGKASENLDFGSTGDLLKQLQEGYKAFNLSLDGTGKKAHEAGEEGAGLGNKFSDGLEKAKKGTKELVTALEGLYKKAKEALQAAKLLGLTEEEQAAMKRDNAVKEIKDQEAKVRAAGLFTKALQKQGATARANYEEALKLELGEIFRKQAAEVAASVAKSAEESRKASVEAKEALLSASRTEREVADASMLKALEAIKLQRVQAEQGRALTKQLEEQLQAAEIAAMALRDAQEKAFKQKEYEEARKGVEDFAKTAKAAEEQQKQAGLSAVQLADLKLARDRETAKALREQADLNGTLSRQIEEQIQLGEIAAQNTRDATAAKAIKAAADEAKKANDAMEASAAKQVASRESLIEIERAEAQAAVDAAELKARAEGVFSKDLAVELERRRQMINAEAGGKKKDLRIQQVKEAAAATKEVFDAIVDAARVAGEIFYDAITGGVFKAFGDAVTEVASIPDQILDAIANIDKAFDSFASHFPEALSKVLVEIPRILERIVTEFPTIVQRIVDALPKLLKAIGDAIPKIVEQIAKALPQIAKAIADAAPEFVKRIMQALPALFEGIGQAIATLIDALPKIFEEFLKGLPKAIYALVGAVGHIIAAIVKAIPQIVKTFAENIVPIVEALVEGILDAIPEIADALIENAFDEASTMKIGRAIGKAFIDAIVSGFKQIKMGIQKTIDFFKGVRTPKAIADIGKNLSEGAKDAGKTLSAAFKKIGLGGGQLFQVSDLAAAALNPFKKAKTDAESLLAAAKKAGAKVWDGFMSVWDKIKNWFKDRGDEIWQGLKAAFGAVAQWFKDRGSEVWEGFLKPIGKWFEEKGKLLWDKFIEPVASWFGDRGTEIWNGFIKPLATWFGDRGTEIWNGFIKPVASWFGDRGTDLWNSLKAGAAKIGDWGTSIWKGLQAAVGSVADTLGEWGTAIWDGLWGAFGWDDFEDMGSSIWDGFWNSWSWNDFKKMGANIWNGFWDAFSWENLKEMGRKISDGFKEGVQKIGGLFGYEGGIVKMAGGGEVKALSQGARAVTGGNSPLNDRVLTLLSEGEGVIDRERMQNPGVRKIYDAIMAGKFDRMPMLSTGGEIAAAPIRSVAARSVGTAAGGTTSFSFGDIIVNAAGGPLDDRFVDQKLMPKIEKRLRRASLDQRKIIYDSGVRKNG